MSMSSIIIQHLRICILNKKKTVFTLWIFFFFIFGFLKKSSHHYKGIGQFLRATGHGSLNLPFFRLSPELSHDLFLEFSLLSSLLNPLLNSLLTCSCQEVHKSTFYASSFYQMINLVFVMQLQKY